MPVSFEESRLQLARLYVDRAHSEQQVLRRATQISGRTLGVSRVGVWFFDASKLELVCNLHYSTDSDSHDEGHVIKLRHSPEYFAALGESRVLVINDARIHDASRSLDEYIASRSIGAMLDAPLYRDGEIIGVLCHEHVGSPRTWLPHEIAFAGSVADIVSALYLEQRLRQLEEEVRVQASVRQDAARLASLMLVTRAFAHDVNNALTVAMLVGSRLESEQSDSLREMGKELGLATSFAGRILRQLRDFTAVDGSERAPLEKILDSFLPVLEALMRKTKVEVQVAAPALATTMSRTHVEQVLINLCVNARDAGAETVTIRAGSSEQRVTIEVIDDGAGIPPALLPRVFEPYVTTKGDGSGLGLSIVRGLVEQSGGTLAVASSIHGTRFTVSLPIANG